MIFGKLFYLIVIVLSFGGLWKILGPTPTSDGNPDIRKRYKTADKNLTLLIMKGWVKRVVKKFF